MAGSLDDQSIRLRLLRLALLHGGEVMQKELKPTIDGPTRGNWRLRGYWSETVSARRPRVAGFGG